ncbi:MAG: hypothetical protein ACRDEA_17895 [Microcystaceae cyanobacterium]
MNDITTEQIPWPIPWPIESLDASELEKTIDNTQAIADIKEYFVTCLRNATEHNGSLRDCITTCQAMGVTDAQMSAWAQEAKLPWSESTVASVLSTMRVESGNRIRAVGGGRRITEDKRSLVEKIIDLALRHAATQVEATAAVRSALRQLEKQTKAESNEN